jgi:hypothetical protein
MSARIASIVFAGISAWLLVTVLPQMVATHMPPHLLIMTSVAVIVYAVAALTCWIETRNNGGR